MAWWMKRPWALHNLYWLKMTARHYWHQLIWYLYIRDNHLCSYADQHILTWRMCLCTTRSVLIQKALWDEPKAAPAPKGLSVADLEAKLRMSSPGAQVHQGKDKAEENSRLYMCPTKHISDFIDGANRPRHVCSTDASYYATRATIARAAADGIVRQPYDSVRKGTKCTGKHN